MAGGGGVKSDIEIAQGAEMRRIVEVAEEKLGIGEVHLEPYGRYKAKVSPDRSTVPPR